MTESLSQTQALLAQEAAGRTKAEQQAGELAELRRTLEQDLAASRQQKANLGAELTAAQAAVADRLILSATGLQTMAGSAAKWSMMPASPSPRGASHSVTARNGPCDAPFGG